MSKDTKPLFSESKRRVNLEDDDVWSDEESDYLIHLPPSQPKVPIESMTSRGDKHMDKVFSGKAKIIYNADNFDDPAKSEPTPFICDVPLPYVPPHVNDILGEDTIKFMWTEFVRYGADDTELLLTEHINDVANAVFDYLKFELPFDQLTFTMGENEYTDFKYVTQTLARLRNDAGVVKHEKERPAALPKCCANKFCQVRALTL